MAIDFPNNPAINDVVVVENKTFRWTGATWNLDSSLGKTGPTGAIGPTGPTGPTGSVYLNATSPLAWDVATSTLSAPTVITSAASAAAISAAIAAHESQQTNVHGIFDVEELETQEGSLEKAQLWASTYVENHRADVTDVHGIPNTADVLLRTTINGKGDLIVGTADNAIAALPVGADGTTLEADSTTATGTRWSSTVSNHIADSSDIHGISDTANLVYNVNNVIKTAAGTAISPYNISAPSLDALQGVLHYPSNAIDTSPRTTNSTTSLANGVAFFTFFTPLHSQTVSNITYVSGSTVSTNVTFGKMGLYTVDSLDVATLVAKTALDTTLLSQISTLYTRPFVAADSYPATYQLIAGQRYAVAIMIIGTVAGSVYMNHTSSPTMINSLPPRMSGAAGSQTDLPTVRSTYSNTVSSPWARLA